MIPAHALQSDPLVAPDPSPAQRRIGHVLDCTGCQIRPGDTLRGDGDLRAEVLATALPDTVRLRITAGLGAGPIGDRRSAPFALPRFSASRWRRIDP
ncbi:MAG: hypothetical protein H6826_14445 [Planctomycetes bacterium]|nr:hypothetical protein [Planctomycetota bacterium]